MVKLFALSNQLVISPDFHIQEEALVLANRKLAEDLNIIYIFKKLANQLKIIIIYQIADRLFLDKLWFRLKIDEFNKYVYWKYFTLFLPSTIVDIFLSFKSFNIC